MSTLAQMRSKIADDMLRSDINTQIDKAINRAILYYDNKQRFWFSETTGTFATIASQEAYGTADGIPSDIVDIDFMRYQYAATTRPDIEPRSYQEIQLLNMGNSTGVPSYYAWYQNKIYFHLIPSSVWTVTVSYRKSYTALSADSDTNDWTVYAEDLIESRAKWDLYDNLLLDDARADRMKLHENDAFISLLQRTNDITGIGIIASTDF